MDQKDPLVSLDHLGQRDLWDPRERVEAQACQDPQDLQETEDHLVTYHR